MGWLAAVLEWEPGCCFDQRRTKWQGRKGRMVMKLESKYGIPNIARVSRRIFYVGLLLGILGLFAVLGLSIFDIDLREILPPCSLYSMTGLYCPGCGGTRACYALAQGHILESIILHPLVFYLAVGYVVYMLSHLLDILTQGKIRGCYFCPYYWYIGVGILLVQFVVKNLALLAGYDLIKTGV